MRTLSFRCREQGEGFNTVRQSVYSLEVVLKTADGKVPPATLMKIDGSKDFDSWDTRAAVMNVKITDGSSGDAGFDAIRSYAARLQVPPSALPELMNVLFQIVTTRASPDRCSDPDWGVFEEDGLLGTELMQTHPPVVPSKSLAFSAWWHALVAQHSDELMRVYERRLKLGQPMQETVPSLSAAKVGTHASNLTPPSVPTPRRCAVSTPFVFDVLFPAGRLLRA